jgi:hypothetical protein
MLGPKPTPEASPILQQSPPSASRSSSRRACPAEPVPRPYEHFAACTAATSLPEAFTAAELERNLRFFQYATALTQAFTAACGTRDSLREFEYMLPICGRPAGPLLRPRIETESKAHRVRPRCGFATPLTRSSSVAAVPVQSPRFNWRLRPHSEDQMLQHTARFRWRLRESFRWGVSGSRRGSLVKSKALAGHSSVPFDWGDRLSRKQSPRFLGRLCWALTSRLVLHQMVSALKRSH